MSAYCPFQLSLGDFGILSRLGGRELSYIPLVLAIKTLPLSPRFLVMEFAQYHLGNVAISPLSKAEL